MDKKHKIKAFGKNYGTIIRTTIAEKSKRNEY